MTIRHPTGCLFSLESEFLVRDLNDYVNPEIAALMRPEPAGAHSDGVPELIRTFRQKPIHTYSDLGLKEWETIFTASLRIADRQQDINAGRMFNRELQKLREHIARRETVMACA